MRTIQALGVMALWTIAIFAIINFVGFNDHNREPLWTLGAAALFVIMLVGNFWIFFAIAKEEPWEWDKDKGSDSE
jgi:membrane protein YdbS with pleckstrin-like domain